MRFVLLALSAFVAALAGLVPDCAAQNFADSFNPDANSTVRTMALQPDGKVIIGGSFTRVGGYIRNGVARLNPEGTVDETFGAEMEERIESNSWGVYSLALQADGKVVVVGNFRDLAGQPCDYIGRLNTDGSLDKDFTVHASWVLRKVVVQPDGKILVGSAGTPSLGPLNLSRLNPDGSVDQTFRGLVVGAIFALAVQADGKLLAGGDITAANGRFRNNLIRLNADGTSDDTFLMGNGPVINGTVYSVLEQLDGKILFGGYFDHIGGRLTGGVGRLNADGSVDLSLTNYLPPAVRSVAAEPNGKILVGSQGVSRFTADGRLETPYLMWPGYVHDVVVQPDGKILVGGEFSMFTEEERHYIGRLKEVPRLFTPQILNDRLFRFSWSNAGTNPFTVLGTTDLALPVGQWDVLGAPMPLGGDLYQFTDPIASNRLQRFYRLRSP